MTSALRPWAAAAVCLLLCRPAPAQGEKIPPPPPPPSTPPEKVPAGDAATVNGQAVPEKAVFRSVRRLPADRREQARKEALNYLIDNTLLDQEMARRRVVVEKREIDDRVAQIRAEVKKDGKDFDQVMKALLLTEDELRAQIAADLRWDRFVNRQATDKALRELFDANRAMFDGSLVHARHILVKPETKDARGAEQAAEKLAVIRRRIEGQVEQGLAKLEPAKRAEARARLLDEAFAEAARKESACPSKARGGDVGWFPRAGKMVEPFARAAFALKPHEMSGAVTTVFGCHLILVVEARPGRPVQFEKIKDVVKDVYGDRLREALLAKLRPAAKIVVNPPPRS